MVIKMELKNVIQRGGNFSFRMRVPKDCIKKIGKREIVQSLKTSDPVVAAEAAKKLARQWEDKFKACRSVKTVLKPVPAISSGRAPLSDDDYRDHLIATMEENLPSVLSKETDQELKDRLDFYRDGIVLIKKDSLTGMDFPEIGVTLPLKPSGSPGAFRLRKKVVCEILGQMRERVAAELGIDLRKTRMREEDAAPVSNRKKASTPVEQKNNLTEAAQLMVSARQMTEKTADAILADIKLLKDWCGGKDDITAYTKRDLIDFIQNALPYVPSNMNKKKKQYAGKSLRECVALVKAHPDTHEPISYRTCQNRQTNLSIVFNYAKNRLGWISTNPVQDISIPEVRITPKRQKGYTSEELEVMWRALEEVKTQTQYPSRYWATVLSLYHGFRLNEVCSLFLKDVYDDADGIYVIDINDDGRFKSVKNKKSVRIVPVHPYVRDHLGFQSFVEAQKEARTEGVLFEDVRAFKAKGYRARVSGWFANWKKEWLPAETQYKHFHDLRYTFIQTAQNVAKMPDRHAQEITGHSVAGVSDVHMAYSGRLKPVDLLPELEKVGYGWENG